MHFHQTTIFFKNIYFFSDSTKYANYKPIIINSNPSSSTFPCSGGNWLFLDPLSSRLSLGLVEYFHFKLLLGFLQPLF